MARSRNRPKIRAKRPTSSRGCRDRRIERGENLSGCYEKQGCNRKRNSSSRLDHAQPDISSSPERSFSRLRRRPFRPARLNISFDFSILRTTVPNGSRSCLSGAPKDGRLPRSDVGYLHCPVSSSQSIFSLLILISKLSVCSCPFV